MRQYVAVDDDVVALTHARVIDGTGAPAREDRTLVLRGGDIVALGPTSEVQIPPGRGSSTSPGRSVIPGLVMLHEHLYYPTGPGVYGNLTESFTRLYLAGGVTSMRTAGNMNGYGELAIARAIRDGDKPGPWIDATAPYLEGPGLPLGQVHALEGADDARRMVDFWADAGATSFKAYMHITRAELRRRRRAGARARAEGHRPPLLGDLSRGRRDLGIDDLEHGFFVATDFVPDKEPDVVPGPGRGDGRARRRGSRRARSSARSSTS